MTRTVIIGDVHGRLEPFMALLKKAGAIDEHGQRIEGVTVIQMGDILDLGYFNHEADFYTKTRHLIDVQMIGNHEWPAFAPNSGAVQFNGWDDRDRDAEILVKRDFREGRFVAAHHVGDWLLVHAGLHPAMQAAAGLTGTAEDIANSLNELLLNDPSNTIFNAIGERRGGGAKFGGIFWNDITDLNEAYANGGEVKQVCGHSSYGETGEQVEDTLWMIDTKGGCAALVTDDDGKTFELIVENREPKPRQVRLSEDEVRDMIRELVEDGELTDTEAQQLLGQTLG